MASLEGPSYHSVMSDFLHLRENGIQMDLQVPIVLPDRNETLDQVHEWLDSVGTEFEDWYIKWEQVDNRGHFDGGKWTSELFLVIRLVVISEELACQTKLRWS